MTNNIPETPASPDIEKLLLGAMLSSDSMCETAFSILEPSDFYTMQHRQIFDAIGHCIRRDLSVDIATVYESILILGMRESFPTPAYLVECTQVSYSYVDVDSMVQILKDKRVHRELIAAVTKVSNMVSGGITNVNDALEEIRQTFFKITGTSSGRDFKTPSQIISGIIERGEAKTLEYKETGKITPDGLTSGYTDIDKLLGGFCPGQFAVIAARTGIGKTAFALNMAYALSYKHKIPTAFFSLEMTNKEIVKRLFSIHSHIPAKKLDDGTLSVIDQEKMKKTADDFDNFPLLINDTGGLKISDFRAKARRAKESHGIKAIFVDYLQMLGGSGRAYENRQTEIADVSRTLKAIAKELELPIICLAQLSRKAEERESKSPVLSDLRESGAIEQDSDFCIFLTRPSAYDQYDKPGVIEVRILKNRHGPTGKVDMTFRGETYECLPTEKYITPPYGQE